MRELALAAMVALGCGRVGFDPSGGGSGGDDGGTIDAAPTGPAGARWVRGFGPAAPSSALGTMVTGAGGETVAVKGFQTSLAIEGMTLAGQSPFGSGAVVRYDAAGGIVSTSILDATGYCEPRGVAMRGDDALVTGLTIGTTADPGFGACSVVTNRQDPFVVRVERGGEQHLAAHWSAGGANAQGWRVAPMADATMVMSGIYGDQLTIGSPLPTALADPSTFMVRFMEALPFGVWSFGLTSASTPVHPGPLATDGNDICTVGAFSAPVTLFGRALPHAGAFDAWVTRLDPSGTPRWIRAIGSAGEESSFGESAVVAAPGGGCYIAILADGDLTADGRSFPRAGGPAVVLHLDATGTVVAGIRLPAVPKIAAVGGRLYAAFDVAAPFTAGGLSYTPMGSDVLVIEIDLASGAPRLAGVLGGAGDQHVWSLAAIASDALAIGARSRGELEFGDVASNSGAADVDVVGALGL